MTNYKLTSGTDGNTMFLFKDSKCLGTVTQARGKIIFRCKETGGSIWFQKRPLCTKEGQEAFIKECSAFWG